MKDKEKQIEEIYNLLFCDKWEQPFMECPEDIKCIECVAKTLYNAGYRKIEKDSVVLTREEYEKVKYVLKYEPEEAIIRLEDLTKNERLYSPHMFCSLGGCSGVSKGCNRTCKESWIVMERKETAEKILNELNNLIKNNEEFGRGVFGWETEEILMLLKIYADKQGVEIKEN